MIFFLIFLLDGSGKKKQKKTRRSKSNLDISVRKIWSNSLGFILVLFLLNYDFAASDDDKCQRKGLNCLDLFLFFSLILLCIFFPFRESVGDRKKLVSIIAKFLFVIFKVFKQLQIIVPKYFLHCIAKLGKSRKKTSMGFG